MSQLSICSAASRTIQPNATITAATNASPIAITTSVAHGLLTGDIVQISGTIGNTAANGEFIVTKTSSTAFTLNNSNGNGVWSSSGTVDHIGFVAGSILTDASVFTDGVPDFTLAARLESLSYGSNVRLEFQDAVDSAYTTALPLICAQAGPGGESTDGERMLCVHKREDMPDARLAVAGSNVRLKVYISGGAFSSAQLSAWLTY